MLANIVPWADLPDHLKPVFSDKYQRNSNFVLIEYNGELLDYFCDNESLDKFDKELQPLIEWINRAYQLGIGNTKDKPSANLCAYLAHMNAEEMRKGLVKAGDDPFEKRKAVEEARKFDEISARFSNGLLIAEVRDLRDELVAFKIKGEGGFTYSLNQTGTTCTCRAALTGSATCWHMRAIEIYLEAYKAL